MNKYHRPGTASRLVTILLGLCLVMPAGFAVRAADSPAGPDYLLGPEDILTISVWKDEHLTKDVVVRR